MSVQIVENSIEIPENIQLALEGRKITVQGPKGKIVKDFTHTKLNMVKEGNTLKLSIENPRRTEAALVGTISAHVKNMIKGVSQGWVYKMKIVFVHFPTAVKVVGKQVHIENFVGERKARIADILGDTKVTIKQEDVILEGIDIDDVSQTAANIQTRARVHKKDLRKFLDGIYVYSKE
ncbi:TPA: 50S ribosomal protein L6 [Candidatus Bathyarchaeota archaeon]|nr:50S ribosomal protein L6 [Candidatus Bathyarchaeota archaeon]